MAAEFALYASSTDNGPLRQGEILEGVREIRFIVSADLASDLRGPSVPAHIVGHPWTVVLNPDCDLEWDFRARQGDARMETKRVEQVLLCDLEDESQLNPSRISEKRLFDLAKGNRDERYHYLPLSQCDDGRDLTEFFIDFKRLFSLRPDFLYAAIQQGIVVRHGVLTAPWVQHLADRFTYFLGRVGLPDTE